MPVKPEVPPAAVTLNVMVLWPLGMRYKVPLPERVAVLSEVTETEQEAAAIALELISSGLAATLGESS